MNKFSFYSFMGLRDIHHYNLIRKGRDGMMEEKGLTSSFNCISSQKKGEKVLCQYQEDKTLFEVAFRDFI